MLCLLCWLRTVSTRAMDLRTTPILASFDAAPPVTLATRSCAVGSAPRASSSSFLFLVRSSCALIFIAAANVSGRRRPADGGGGASGPGVRIARSKPSREDLGGRLRRRRPLTHGRACRLQHARPCHRRRRRSQARAAAPAPAPALPPGKSRRRDMAHRRRTQPDARARPVVAGSAARGARGTRRRSAKPIFFFLCSLKTDAQPRRKSLSLDAARTSTSRSIKTPRQTHDKGAERKHGQEATIACSPSLLPGRTGGGGGGGEKPRVPSLGNGADCHHGETGLQGAGNEEPSAPPLECGASRAAGAAA